ncbi:hypothetical protein EMIHUDRAFT_196943 [Emiliania huxleyi CCMP1516]|uniref:Coenzyme Q-binding protein COQ10 START domain-containing protein n=2 Tax=Emiliania huxleyi TaxID=2903 RepID=A0A0D3ITG0_EMIH1|nr:hypothetical protein EMIHUDRAFT_196943 [Emiliania huxleyi CCMP1516]EOD14545.1 hypothetical protein EMIHUDRAFT_196943 [Emiliania huxleyi CCMP1516]|eukprot:XP_005766974.1 hypothetical protein EMIHUDRAFT_196943 [Emiliania huxleyi CCMP1516]
MLSVLAIAAALNVPLRQAVVPRAAHPLARAAGVMQTDNIATGAVPVSISTTGFNSRCISASIVVSAPPEAVWAILTDYDNLSTHEGAQRIVGFDFRASLTMDMTAMFGAFEGEWRVQPYSRTRARGGSSDALEYTTRLSYKVDITPRGLVPVPALEWRIREDVPLNLRAVRAAAEKLHARRQRGES